MPTLRTDSPVIPVPTNEVAAPAAQGGKAGKSGKCDRMNPAKAINTTDDGFEWAERYLGTWAYWMRHPGLRLGAPSRSPGFRVDITGGYRDEGAESEIVGHDRAIQVIEATLDGLSPVEQAAVMHVHLYAVFRFRHPVDQIYRFARMKIGIRLRANDFF